MPVFLVAQGGLTFCQMVLAQLNYARVFAFLYFVRFLCQLIHCHTYAYLDVRVYALYYVCLDVCYLVTHNACMRARLDDDFGLDCFLGIPRLDLVHNPLRECMRIRNRT